MKRTAALVLALLGACSGNSVEGGLTGVRVSVTYDTGLDQIAVSGRVDSDPTMDGGTQSTMFGPTLRPDTPRPLAPGGESVVLIVSDSFGGRTFVARADGLLSGVVVASGESSVTLVTGQIVEVAIHLGLPAICGDGTVRAPLEACDDMNTQSGDGCSSACQVEPGYHCTGAPSSCRRDACDAISCPTGCCNGSSCIVQSRSACGSGGGVCTACDTTANDRCAADGTCACGDGPSCPAMQRCMNGACICDAISCPTGCCDGNVCRPGDTRTSCGTSGGACQPCGAGDTCTDGVCSGCAATCPDGCCSGTTCNPMSITSCGLGGVACVACDPMRADACTNGNCLCGDSTQCVPGQQCLGGRCVCTAISCPAGCCNGATCIDRSLATCGAAGSTCVGCDATRANNCSADGNCRCGTDRACGPGQTCTAGVGCTCDPTSCPSGCCDMAGVCHPPSLGSCATSGNSCNACDPDRADQCVGGACRCGSSAQCGMGQRCDSGNCICDALSCAGCCAGGACQLTSSAGACGSGGAACAMCPGGQTCGGGVCSGCTASSCPTGCCSGATCTTPTVIACGFAGSACFACDPDRADHCASGACMCGTSTSCGTGQRCVNGSCVCDGFSCPSGCCTGSTCNLSSSATCGVAGATCTSCDARYADNCSATGSCSCGSGAQCVPGQRCSGGTCVCDALSCPSGCCSANSCTSRSVATCGTMGAACMACDTTRSDGCSGAGACTCGGGVECDPGQHCSGGHCVCDPTSCAGCCSGTTCLPGTTPGACGAGGGSCATCPGVQRCLSGACEGCNSTSCAGGCCSGTTCVSPPSLMACGTSGQACGACNTNISDRCNASGNCVCGGSPGAMACGPGQHCVSGGCVCDAASCPSGCCNGNTCFSRSTATCGISGAMCVTCGLTGRSDNCSSDGICSCGTNPRCDPGQRCVSGTCICDRTSCASGCCTKNTCNPESFPTCGTSGNACTACDPMVSDGCDSSGACSCGGGMACVSGQRCDRGSCVCDPMSCSGCCSGTSCLPGTSGMACGSGGTGCVSCPGSQPCDAGGVCAGCNAVTCAGCCSGPSCTAPPTQMACGVMGAACNSCDPARSDSCGMNGDCACGGAPACATGQNCGPSGCACDPSSCGGCCEGTACLSGGANDECGTGGAMCMSCPSGTRCNNAACICDPTSCPGGCCDLSGVCQPGTSDMACGSGGDACVTCEDLTTCVGQICNLGT